MLTRYPKSINVAIIGASGGIGQAFVKCLAEDKKINKIYAFSRSHLPFNINKAIWGSIDITDETSIINAANSIKESVLNLVIVATGILHENEHLKPEKNIKQISASTLNQVFLINTIGPTLVAKHFLPLLDKKEKSLFAALSARVGSISDNSLGGWYSYRASKAALNMMIKNLSIEALRFNPNSIIVGLHPGTVDTALSKPFQKNVPKEKLFSPEFAAKKLINVIDELSIQSSGKLFAWDGSEIPF